ncbi:MAG: GAF domain-containing protein, partial [Deltaproteobacteria bacterium]|nr:GAF domain-containing protein [Deltaproteobacteria bacterium]
MQTRAEIVLVTTDDTLAKNVRSALVEDDLEVTRVSDAETAGNRAATSGPLLVLLDAGDDAAAACSVLRVKNASGEVVILALVDDPDDQAMAALLQAGADDVLSRTLRPLGFRARLGAYQRKVETSDELARKVRDSHVLIEITSRLVSAGDLLSNLYDMAHLLSEELAVDRCSVVLIRPQQDYGLVIASSDDPDVRSLPIMLGRYPEIQRVARDGEPLVVDDVSDSDLLEQVLPDLRSARVTSVALFPIVRDGVTLGVIFLRFAEKRESFDEREKIFCQTVANATAIALRNAEIAELLKAKTLEVEQVQNQARSQLKALEPYEVFFKSSVDGMVVLSGTGVVLFVNPVGSAMLDRSRETVLGYPFVGFIEDGERPLLSHLLEDSFRGRNPGSVDFRMTVEQGSERVISISASALGSEGMTLLTMRDVTEERAMGRRLAEA